MLSPATVIAHTLTANMFDEHVSAALNADDPKLFADFVRSAKARAAELKCSSFGLSSEAKPERFLGGNQSEEYVRFLQALFHVGKYWEGISAKNSLVDRLESRDAVAEYISVVDAALSVQLPCVTTTSKVISQRPPPGYSSYKVVERFGHAMTWIACERPLSDGDLNVSAELCTAIKDGAEKARFAFIAGQYLQGITVLRETCIYASTNSPENSRARVFFHQAVQAVEDAAQFLNDPHIPFDCRVAPHPDIEVIGYQARPPFVPPAPFSKTGRLEDLRSGFAELVTSEDKQRLVTFSRLGVMSLRELVFAEKRGEEISKRPHILHRDLDGTFEDLDPLLRLGEMLILTAKSWRSKLVADESLYQSSVPRSLTLIGNTLHAWAWLYVHGAESNKAQVAFPRDSDPDPIRKLWRSMADQLLVEGSNRVFRYLVDSLPDVDKQFEAAASASLSKSIRHRRYDHAETKICDFLDKIQRCFCEARINPSIELVRVISRTRNLLDTIKILQKSGGLFLIEQPFLVENVTRNSSTAS